MNDPSKLMNPPPLQQMIGQPQQRINPVQPRIMNQTPLLNQSQGLNHPIICMMNQQSYVMMNNNSNNQPMMMNPRSFNPYPSLTSEYHNQPNNHSRKRTEKTAIGKERRSTAATRGH